MREYYDEITNLEMEADYLPEGIGETVIDNLKDARAVLKKKYLKEEDLIDVENIIDNARCIVFNYRGQE